MLKEYVPPTVRLSDLGSRDPCVEKMFELVAMPLTHPEVYLHTGVQASSWRVTAWTSRLWQDYACKRDWWGAHRSIRTYCIVARTDELDQELGVPFISVSAPSIVSGMSGGSEKTLRETFEEAKVRYTFLFEMLYGS
jgi:ribosome biogenesis ATPase